MSNIDTSTWGDFLITDMFELFLSKGDNQEKKLNDGDIPLVSSGNKNNGICKFIDKGDGKSQLFEKNMITVDMFGQSFYQEKEFYAVSHGRVNILKPKFELDKNIGLFLATILTSSLNKKYGFKDMCSQKVLKKEKIKLPVDSFGKPDYEFMKEYIKSIEVETDSIVSELASVNDNKEKIDNTNWKNYKIEDVFVTELNRNKKQVPTGASVKKKNLKEGDTPRITVKGINNGIIGKFDCDLDNKDYRTYENFISVSFLGTIFYHPYLASLEMKVHCLKPKHICLNKYTGLFLVSALKASLRESTYSDQFSSRVLPDMFIKLPATETGEPDYKAMEKFIKDIETKNKEKIDNLEKL